MEWLTDQKIPIGKWAAGLFDWLQTNGAWFFDGLSEAMEALIDAHPLGSANAAPVDHGRRLCRADLSVAAQLETDRADRAGVPVHPESGLLGRNHRKPDAGPVGLRGLHGGGCAHRHCRCAPAQALSGDAPRAGSDADAAHLCLSDPRHRVFRHRHGARPDCHGDLCAARADPADPSGGHIHTATLCWRRRRRSGPPRARRFGRSNCPMPCRRS